jgi:hypothetical protein
LPQRDQTTGELALDNNLQSKNGLLLFVSMLPNMGNGEHSLIEQLLKRQNFLFEGKRI